jgi:hypothetical protein
MRVNPPVTLSNENGPSRSRSYRDPYPVTNGRQRRASGGRTTNDTAPGFPDRVDQPERAWPR